MLSSLCTSNAGLNNSRFSVGAANTGATEWYEILSGPSHASAPVILIDESSIIDGGPDSRSFDATTFTWSSALSPLRALRSSSARCPPSLTSAWISDRPSGNGLTVIISAVKLQDAGDMGVTTNSGDSLS